MIKYSYVKHCPGHVSSDGSVSPWCIISHDTGKIISSHKTKDDAEKHLRDIEIHKSYAEVIQINSEISAVRYADLLPGGKGDNLDINVIPKDELKAGMEVESEHTPNKEIQKEIVQDHEQECIEATGKPSYYEDWLLEMEDKMKENRK